MRVRVFYYIVWGCGTGLPNLDHPQQSIGVPSKTFDFVFLINGLHHVCVRVCRCARVMRGLDFPSNRRIMSVPVEESREGEAQYKQSRSLS